MNGFFEEEIGGTNASVIGLVSAEKCQSDRRFQTRPALHRKFPKAIARKKPIEIGKSRWSHLRKRRGPSHEYFQTNALLLMHASNVSLKGAFFRLLVRPRDLDKLERRHRAAILFLMGTNAW